MATETPLYFPTKSQQALAPGRQQLEQPHNSRVLKSTERGEVYWV